MIDCPATAASPGHEADKTASDKPLRAARWDGVFPIGPGDGLSPVDVADVRAMLSLIHGERASAVPFDVVVRGRTFRQDPGAARTMLAEYAGAGVTWWLESLSHRTPMDELRAQVAKGPPAER